ncbi:MAG: DUF3256 family protein [Bacteroides sp.]|nr:DUF3256 family protein [Bacteroides sp.]
MMRLVCVLIIWMCTWSVAAQDMKNVFLAMPDSLTPLLTKVNKEDCIDFLASSMKAEVKNRFDQTAEMKMLTDDYLQIQMTAKSSLEMKLLPVNDSVKVVCLIKTVCASVCDSEVHFYTSDWSRKLSTTDYWQCPENDAFYLPMDSITEEYTLIRKQADLDLMKMSLSKDDTNLSVVYTTPDFLNEENKKNLLPYLRKESLVYRWENGKFR